MYRNGSSLDLKSSRGFWKNLHMFERGRAGVYNEKFSRVNA